MKRRLLTLSLLCSSSVLAGQKVSLPFPNSPTFDAGSTTWKLIGTPSSLPDYKTLSTDFAAVTKRGHAQCTGPVRVYEVSSVDPNARSVDTISLTTLQRAFGTKNYSLNDIRSGPLEGVYSFSADSSKPLVFVYHKHNWNAASDVVVMCSAKDLPYRGSARGSAESERRFPVPTIFSGNWQETISYDAWPEERRMIEGELQAGAPALGRAIACGSDIHLYQKGLTTAPSAATLTAELKKAGYTVEKYANGTDDAGDPFTVLSVRGNGKHVALSYVTSDNANYVYLCQMN
ncbi:hypothetical protein MF271_00705 (plasmid) [Deinococcus sp. KNUC1210]|uniref:hypothetical protein n=1 Tax=Deinococcus sp. KNUC1210 TaxID=2917691 RepID=UPI001EF0C96F|nr:hypothetical protein [Deinococcus sp. KNUC1210]ULH14032.1 hypothetical protein MF271_00705 [Deinococcus sp. KNUC1210]